MDRVLYDIKGNTRRQRKIIFRWMRRGGSLESIHT
jgi:hypothetical protein